MYLVTYDITSDRLRNKVAKKLLDYGKRVQFSVFECDIDNKRFKMMYAELQGLIFEQQEASIRIYVLDRAAASKTMVLGDQIFLPKKDDVFFI